MRPLRDSSFQNIYQIGYDTIRSREITHSQIKIQNKDFTKGFIGSPEQLIQGKMAGVQVFSSSGEPGSGAQINVRGYSSISLNNNPLIIVDGFPLSEFDNSPAGIDLFAGNLAAKNPLNFLDPNNIQSIEVIKDLSAAAIYGARGANGVIIITTKSGASADKRFELSTSVGFSQPTKRYDLLDRDSFLANLEDFGEDPIENDFGENTNWQNEVSSQKISYRYDLAFSDSYKRGSYRVYFGFENQEGVIKNSSLRRPNLSLQVNQTFLNDKLNLRLSVSAAEVSQESPLITNNGAGLLGGVYSANPTLSTDPDDQDALQSFYLNPSSALSYYYDQTKSQKGISTLSLDYQLLPNLNLVVNNGYDLNISQRDQAVTPDMQSGSIFGNGKAAQQEMISKSYLLEAMLKFKKDFGDHHISAMGGFAYQNFYFAHTTLQGFGFQGVNASSDMLAELERSGNNVRNRIGGSYQSWGIDADQFFINRLSPVVTTDFLSSQLNAVNVDALVENKNEQVNELQSFFGRFNYNFSDKYFISTVLRVDGSSRFSPNYKYGVFPGISAAWLLSNEEFMTESSISYFKVRAGYGVTGNQALPHNAYIRRQRFSSIGFNDGGEIIPPGLQSVSFDNPDFKWEETREINLGLDYGFLNNRLTGTLNFYRRKTSDIMARYYSPQPSPQLFSWFSLDANVINKGLELSLNYNLLNKTNWNWNFGFNISYNDNILENYEGSYDQGDLFGQGLFGAFSQRTTEGQPLFAFFVKDFAGYNEDGEAEYNEGDFKQFVGKGPIPIYNLGIISNLNYRNFDLDFNFVGQFGHYVYNNTANAFFTAGAYGNGRNVTEDVLTSGEAPINSPDVSTRFLEKGDFLRLQNLVLSYNFNFDNSNAFTSLKISAIGQNLLTLTSYSGIDPEVFKYNNQVGSRNGPGIDYVSYPRAKTYSLGVNLVF